MLAGTTVTAMIVPKDRLRGNRGVPVQDASMPRLWASSDALYCTARQISTGSSSSLSQSDVALDWRRPDGRRLSGLRRHSAAVVSHELAAARMSGAVHTLARHASPSISSQACRVPA